MISSFGNYQCNCNVDDYNITTLFDNEKTFNKKELKFVVADVFEFVYKDHSL